MEITTLQQRIEERAKLNLLKDLLEAANKESSIAQMIDFYESGKLDKEKLWEKKLNVIERYDYSNKKIIELKNEYSKKVFAALLPKYISLVTDEILNKIDDIDYVLNHPKPF